MKHTRTGDTMAVQKSRGKKIVSDELAQNIVLDGVPTPPAVFSVAVQAESTSQQREVEAGLSRLLAEDPSLRLSTDPRSGETLLSGMGQLHLDVACDRLRSALNQPIYLSEPRVAYRETIGNSIDHAESYDSVIGSARLRASLSLRLEPIREELTSAVCPVNADSESRSQLGHLPVNQVILPEDIKGHPVTAELIRNGVLSALHRGPLLGSPTSAIRVIISSRYEDINASSDAALTACASKATSSALLRARCVLLEPIMDVECILPGSCVGDVIEALTHPLHRRGIVEKVERDEDTRSSTTPDSIVRVRALVPVQGMIDWATRIRSTTKGRGDFTMEFHSYQAVDAQVQGQIIASLRN
jgi:elongation factor G